MIIRLPDLVARSAQRNPGALALTAPGTSFLNAGKAESQRQGTK